MVGFRKPHHFDRNRNLREVLIHVTEDIQGYSKFKITIDAKMTLRLFQGKKMVGIDKHLILSLKTMAIAFMN